MIINFSVKNFGSIKEQQTLSFEADNSGHLENHYTIHTIGGLRLLKLALIYGANASGKTTVLNALEFLRNLVLEPEEKKTNELDFNPFLFDSETPEQNSILSIDFIQNSIRYFYEVEFFKKAIVREELYFHNPNRANVFKRTTNLANQFTEISFGSKIKRDKVFEKTLESNTLWNNTVLGGFLKTNIELKELKEATDWFSEYLRPQIHTKTKLEKYITSQIQKSEISKEDIITILKKADFNISDIIIKEEDDNPEGFIDKLFKRFLNDFEYSEMGIDGEKIERKLSKSNLGFEHNVANKKFHLPLELESHGTRRYYEFSGLLALLIKKSLVFSIDELEASLHPELFQHFILSFLINAENSQLIATTHNREILDNRDIFRDDAIWITDKDQSSSTVLYSLADFDSSIIRDTTNRLNVYKSGKLGGIPNLGDYYIELNYEK